MQRLHVHDRLRGLATVGTENVGRPVFELRFPDRDLVGMHIELLGKLRNRSVAFDGCKGHFRFESRCVVPEQWSRFFEQNFRVDKWNLCQG